jgi:hypothetical protein
MQIADVTTQHVIEDLVDLNFGEDEPAPRLVFDEIGSQQAATAQALKLLVDAGVIHPDQILEETSRQQYGLPPADPSTATPPPAAPVAAPAEPVSTPSERPGSVAAAFGVDTHPGGEELKHYWLAGPGAAKWATWTELYDHLKSGKGLTDEQAKRIAAAWFHIRYGYWPGDHRNLTAAFNPAQLRDPDGEWGDGVPGRAAARLIGRLGSEDGLDLEVSHEPGGVVVRFPFPDDAGNQVDRAVLDHASVARLSAELGTAETAGKARRAELHAAIRRVDATAAGSPEHADALAAFWRVADQDVAEGSVPGAGGTSLHWRIAAGEDDVTLSAALKPAGAGPGWSFDGAVSDGAGGTYPLAAVGKLRTHLRKAGGGKVASSAADPDADPEADEWEEAIAALVAALAELGGVQASAFDEARHPRGPGGRFRSTVDKLKSAIQEHRAGNGKGDPFAGFDREQLRRAAKTQGITLGRGEDRDSIATKLLDHLDGPKPKAEPKPAEPKPEVKAPEVKTPVKRAPRKRAAPKQPAEPLPVEPADLGRGEVGQGRDRLSDVMASVRFYGDGNPYDWRQTVFGKYDVRDGVLTELVREQGFGLPELGSVDDAVQAGGVELFRGVTSNAYVTGAQQIAAMRDDPGFGYGNGIYGNGIYFSVEKRVAAAFAGQHPDYNAPDAGGATVRVSLRKGAKIVTLRKLEADRKKWLAAHRGEVPPAMEDWLYDNGRWAAMLGYDAIRIDGKEDGFQVFQPSGKTRQNKATQYIVLNRGAITMEAG